MMRRVFSYRIFKHLFWARRNEVLRAFSPFLVLSRPLVLQKLSHSTFLITRNGWGNQIRFKCLMIGLFWWIAAEMNNWRRGPWGNFGMVSLIILRDLTTKSYRISINLKVLFSLNNSDRCRRMVIILVNPSK